MKKIALIALLLIAVLGLTACGPTTFSEADTDKLVTLGKYKGLTYDATDVSVSDYELNVAVNNALSEKGYAKTESGLSIKEGTVQLGDTVDIDYRGLKGGVAFDGGTATGQALTIGSGQFIAGFEEGLVGKAIGSDVKLNLTFPDNYHSADMAGQAVVFEVKINAVTKRVTYSELTDAIANELNGQIKTAEEYKNALKTQLEESKKASAKSTEMESIWNQIISTTTFKKLPKKLVEKGITEFENHFTDQAIQTGFTTLESFVTAQGLTMEQFDAAAKENAENSAKNYLVAYAIAKAEGYTVSDEVFRSSAKIYAAQNNYANVDNYIAIQGKDTITDWIILEYAMNFVYENAKAK